MAIPVSIAVTIAGFAFATGGGIDVARTGTVLAIIVLAVTVAFGRAAWTGRLPRPFSGAAALLLMATFAGLAALSVSWSILPGDSNFDAVRVMTYAVIVAGGALAAQLMPGRGREVVVGLLLAALLICAYGLVSRIHPAWFPESDAYSRVRMPFEYWNAVGAVAVFGLLASLWAGTTRALDTRVVALSYAAGGVFLLTLALSQSRGAMATLLLTLGLWLLLAPRRLRSAGWLAAVAVVTLPLIAWAFGQAALSSDFVAPAQRAETGSRLGLLIMLMIAALAAVGWAVERGRRLHHLSPRRRYLVGRALLVALAISPILLAGGVAMSSDQGLGKITAGVGDMFDPDEAAPSNSPDRLTQTSSLRARYWRDAFKVFADNTVHGTGADTYYASRLPYRHDTIKVRHAHGFVPQMMADLGVLGLLVTLSLAVAWLAAMGRALGSSRAAPYRWLDDEGDRRLAELMIALIAVAFGLHSAIDWTWYVPGVAAFGLLTAGWTFGRRRRLGGSETGGGTESSTTQGNRAARLATSAGIALIGLIAAYGVYQPARAAQKVNSGYQLLADGRPQAALRAGVQAHDIDPTSDEPYYLQAAAYNNLRRTSAADAALTEAASMQPANPDTWIRLADYRLSKLRDPERALEALKPLLFLSPNNERGTALRARAEQELATRLLREQLEQERRRIARRLRAMRRQQAATPNP